MCATDQPAQAVRSMVVIVETGLKVASRVLCGLMSPGAEIHSDVRWAGLRSIRGDIVQAGILKVHLEQEATPLISSVD